MSPEDEKKPARKAPRRARATTKKPARAAKRSAPEERVDSTGRAAKADAENPQRVAKDRKPRRPQLRARGRTADRKRRRPKLGRLRTGEAIYLAAAILLFVLMFLTWFKVSTSQQAGAVEELNLVGSGGDAWQTLDVIPLFLMLAIAVTVGAAILRLARSDWKPVLAPGAAVCVLGLLASLLVLIRIVSPPSLGTPQLAGYEFSTTLQLPIFLALAAALGIAYGGWRAMDEEGTSFGGVAKRLESPRRPGRPKSKPDPKPIGTSKQSGKPKPASGSKS